MSRCEASRACCAAMDRAPTVGAGAVAEADTLKGIFGTNQNEFQRKTLLALLPDVPGDVVPEDLNRLLRFRIAELTRDGIDDLLRAIFSAPKHVAAPVGSPPQFDEPVAATPTVPTHRTTLVAGSTPRPGSVQQFNPDRRLKLSCRSERYSTAFKPGLGIANAFNRSQSTDQARVQPGGSSATARPRTARSRCGCSSPRARRPRPSGRARMPSAAWPSSGTRNRGARTPEIPPRQHPANHDV